LNELKKAAPLLKKYGLTTDPEILFKTIDKDHGG
jgi:hypothetical protein